VDEAVCQRRYSLALKSQISKPHFALWSIGTCKNFLIDLFTLKPYSAEMIRNAPFLELACVANLKQAIDKVGLETLLAGAG